MKNSRKKSKLQTNTKSKLSPYNNSVTYRKETTGLEKAPRLKAKKLKTSPYKMKGFSGFGNLVENARKMSGSLTAGQAANVIEEMKTGSMAAPENRVRNQKAPSGNYLERRKKKKSESKKQKIEKIIVEPPISGARGVYGLPPVKGAVAGGAMANAGTSRKTRRKLQRQQFAQSLKKN